MKIVFKSNLNMPGMAGMGPAAWDGDMHKMSMHPPLPEHIDPVEEELQRHNHEHHVVHRHDSEGDQDENGIRLVPVPSEEMEKLFNDNY